MWWSRGKGRVDISFIAASGAYRALSDECAFDRSGLNVWVRGFHQKSVFDRGHVPARDQSLQCCSKKRHTAAHQECSYGGSLHANSRSPHGKRPLQGPNASLLRSPDRDTGEGFSVVHLRRHFRTAKANAARSCSLDLSHRARCVCHARRCQPLEDRGGRSPALNGAARIRATDWCSAGHSI